MEPTIRSIVDRKEREKPSGKPVFPFLLGDLHGRTSGPIRQIDEPLSRVNLNAFESVRSPNAFKVMALVRPRCRKSFIDGRSTKRKGSLKSNLKFIRRRKKKKVSSVNDDGGQ